MYNFTEVMITYKVGNSQLLNRGSYKECVTKVINGNASGKDQRKLNWKEVSPGHFKKGVEQLIIKEPLKILREPEYTQGKIATRLGEAFIANCLKQPDKPRNNAKFHDYELFRKWKTLTQKQKITYHVERYVKDMGGFDPTIELL